MFSKFINISSIYVFPVVSSNSCILDEKSKQRTREFSLYEAITVVDVSNKYELSARDDKRWKYESGFNVLKVTSST